MRNHFMKITFRFVCYHWDSCSSDFYISKGDLIRIIVKNTHCLCSILIVCDQENINQVTQKTLIYNIYSGSVQGFWKLPPSGYTGMTFVQHRGDLCITRTTKSKKSFALLRSRSANDFFYILKFLPIHADTIFRLFIILTAYLIILFHTGK